MSFSHHAVLAALFLVIGSSVGSFLNVCVYRLPRGLSLLRPGSRCPRCLAAVRAYDNIPVFGWLILRGRCRHCGGAISPRYPMVELATGFSFAGVYLVWVALAPIDVWEQTGGPGVLVRLLLLWSLIGIALVTALVAYDSMRLERDRQLSSFPRDSEGRSGLSSIDRAGGGEEGADRADCALVAGIQPAAGFVREGCAVTQPASGDDGRGPAERGRDGRSVVAESCLTTERGREAAAGNVSLRRI